jgi:dephospho-CoA kinase
VGAGKSSVVRHIRSLRLFIVDADRIGHEQLQTRTVRDEIVKVFGAQVLDDQGQISRPLLAAQVFGDTAEQQALRAQLNAIVHPAIRAEMRRQIKSAPQDVDVVILDAALLLEAGWADECDSVIFIETSLSQRQQRTSESRGWSAEEHLRREASQWDLDRKRSFCPHKVDNSGSPESAALQMEQILQQVIREKSQTGDASEESAQH